MKAVLQLTDLHIFEDAGRTMLPIDTKQSFQLVLAKALEHADDWDLVVLSGDLADLGEEQSYVWLAAQLKNLSIPAVVLPGNHDDRELMGKYFDCATSLQLGAWQLCLLDSCVPPSTKGQLGDDQVAALHATLRNHPERPHLVFLHHPPVLLGSSWMDGMGLSNAAVLWDCMKHVDTPTTLVAGHAHQNFDVYHNGVRVLVTPSTCTQFVPRTTRFALDSRTAGFRRLELHDDGHLETSVVRV